MPIVVDIISGDGGESVLILGCSVDSDDDFRWGYRDVSHYYCLLAVTTSQEYSYLEDQTKQSKDTFVLKLLIV